MPFAYDDESNKDDECIEIYRHLYVCQVIFHQSPSSSLYYDIYILCFPVLNSPMSLRVLENIGIESCILLQFISSVFFLFENIQLIVIDFLIMFGHKQWAIAS